MDFEDDMNYEYYKEEAEIFVIGLLNSIRKDELSKDELIKFLEKMDLL